MQAFYRTWTFWIAACSWLALVGGHYATVLPAPYGLVLANAVAIVYAATRCLQKRQAGVPWKGIFFTSEFAVTSATVVMNFLDAVSKIPALPPKALGAISGAIVTLGALLHTLSGTRREPTAGLKPLSVTQETAAIEDLARDNVASGVPDKAHGNALTPTLLGDARSTGVIEWYEYEVTGESDPSLRTLCMAPKWTNQEVLDFLEQREVVKHGATCTIRALQRDENGMRVFQVIEDDGNTLTFVFKQSMGRWRPK